jgi:hypothetical protein
MQSLISKISKKNSNFAPKLMKMVKLYVFNPEHDLALAANLSNFTAPHAGRQLRHDLGYLPALWAGDDDLILVDDVETAVRAYGRLRAKVGGTPKKFINASQLANEDITDVEPWGWDLALRAFLKRKGVDAVPTEQQIEVIRDLSHRKHAIDLLRQLQLPGTIGDSCCADTIFEIRDELKRHGKVVVKAPWSSSGRGIRFVDNEIDQHLSSWVNKTIERQGNIIAEKYNNKVKDFGMEFESDGEGGIRYLGLSLFHTQKGAYTGNILATEEEKTEMISHYISSERLDSVKEKICICLGPLYKGRYKGPFGVDLMIVRGNEDVNFLLNPCVEINLRRTMGHVAIELSKHCHSGSVMNILYSENVYCMKVDFPSNSL